MFDLFINLLGRSPATVGVSLVVVLALIWYYKAHVMPQLNELDELRDAKKIWLKDKEELTAKVLNVGEQYVSLVQDQEKQSKELVALVSELQKTMGDLTKDFGAIIQLQQTLEKIKDSLRHNPDNLGADMNKMQGTLDDVFGQCAIIIQRHDVITGALISRMAPNELSGIK